MERVVKGWGWGCTGGLDEEGDLGEEFAEVEGVEEPKSKK